MVGTNGQLDTNLINYIFSSWIFVDYLSQHHNSPFSNIQNNEPKFLGFAKKIKINDLERN